MKPNRGYRSPDTPRRLPKVPAGPAEGPPATGGFLRQIQDNMDRVRAEGLGPINPPIFYGGNVQLAREIGIPVFINGDTGEVERVGEAGEDIPAPPAVTPQERFDQWFNAITGCLLNIVLAGLVLVSYSA